MTDRKKFDTVFVVLTYKSSADLRDFLESVKMLDVSSKVIVVDAFFSEECSRNIMEMAKLYCADYISIENKGYSYGNNYGINYAKEHYEFDYVIVSNPDIEVKKMNLDNLIQKNAVYGPYIQTANGKRQNPYRPCYFAIGEYIQYKGYKKNKRRLVWFNIVFNKIFRELFFVWERLSRKQSYIVYALHGSFIVFTRAIIEKFHPIFFEKQFLFAEEDYLAFMMRKNNIPMVYTKEIEVLHKEDGSVGISNIDVSGFAKESYIEYYENRKNSK